MAFTTNLPRRKRMMVNNPEIRVIAGIGSRESRNLLKRRYQDLVKGLEVVT